MGTKLGFLVERLKNDVPARNSVPSDVQYDQVIRDAVADYSRRRPRKKHTSLSIVSGTASYDLPTDFVQLIRLASPVTYVSGDQGVLVTSDGLVPLSSDWQEEHYVAPGSDGVMELTFYPTPTYSTTRIVWYAAGHALNASDEYPNMVDDDVEVLMHRARSLALELQAGVAAREAWQYAIGDERVAKEKLASEMRAAADAAEKRYQAALAGGIGPVGVRSRFDQLGR